jgi:hypothetical protein
MMISQSVPANTVCDRLRKIGYSYAKTVKLYGEILELVSDPFTLGDDFAVRAHPQHSSQSALCVFPSSSSTDKRARP